MLPVFPNARKELADTFSHYLFEAFWNESPILQRIPVSPQLEGREASYERSGGEMVDVEYKAQSVQRMMDFEVGRGLDPETFMDTAASIGEEMARKMTEDLFADVSKAIESVGNVTVSEGDGISFEAFLEMNSKVQLEFNDDGKPVDRTIVLSPEAHKRFVARLHEWHADPEKCAAMEAVLKKKKKEFDEREACRRMVD